MFFSLARGYVVNYQLISVVPDRQVSYFLLIDNNANQTKKSAFY